MWWPLMYNYVLQRLHSKHLQRCSLYDPAEYNLDEEKKSKYAGFAQEHSFAQQ